MRRPALALLLLAATSVAAHATEKQVYRLDSVTAVAVKGGIQIQAKGAVRSGGWSHPRLKITHIDAHTVIVEFLAQPPASGTVVIQGLLPVSAQVTVKAGSGVTSVRVEADANDVTAQVLR
jgi:hypothetical protein